MFMLYIYKSTISLQHFILWQSPAEPLNPFFLLNAGADAGVVRLARSNAKAGQLAQYTTIVAGNIKSKSTHSPIQNLPSIIQPPPKRSTLDIYLRSFLHLMAHAPQTLDKAEQQRLVLQPQLSSIGF